MKKLLIIPLFSFITLIGLSTQINIVKAEDIYDNPYANEVISSTTRFKTYLQLDYNVNSLTRYMPARPDQYSPYYYTFNLLLGDITPYVIYNDNITIGFTKNNVTFEFDRISFGDVNRAVGWTYDEDFFDPNNPEYKQILITVSDQIFDFTPPLDTITDENILRSNVLRNIEELNMYIIYDSTVDPINAGYNAGYRDGYLKGFDDGERKGFNDAIDIDAYQKGYEDGANESFLANFDKWIVPAIIVIMILGGYFAVRRQKMEEL